MNYRPDIQILRGISVFFVVTYHLGFKLFQSGFLGVDVFFVISGFLMSVLYDDNKKWNFLQRRASRLLPSYFVVILFTLIFSFAVTTPNETKQVVSQALFGSIFSSNVGFWMQNSYFSKLEFNPLLHLWSLGVEIQFYICVPVLAWLIIKNKYSLSTLILLSAALCFIVTTISPKTSFFMMPFRLWEFLLGYAAAHYFTHAGEIKYPNKKYLGLIGILIITSIPFFQVRGDDSDIVFGHPGLIALIISLATCIVLIYGVPKLVSRSFIGTQMEIIGKYSYAIYLVHFPIIVLYLHEPFNGTILKPSTTKDLIFIVLMISITTACLYKFVEDNKSHRNKVSILALFITLILVFILPKAQNLRLTDEEHAIFNASEDRTHYRCGKIIRILNPTALTCELTNHSAEISNAIMLVGNSHADSIKHTFKEIAQDKNIHLHFVVKNNPLLQGGPTALQILTEAINKNIDHLVLHYSPTSIPFENIKILIETAAEHYIRVTLIEPVPIWENHIPQHMFLNTESDLKNEMNLDRYTYEVENSKIFSELKELDYSNYDQVSVVDVFCTPECVYKTEDGTPLYFDDNHLTLTGSSKLEDKIKNIF